MPVNNSRREYLYALFSKLYPQKIEKALNVKLKNIQLERYFKGRRVDLCATAEGTRYYIEFTLKNMDEDHFIQLQKIISLIANPQENTVVVSCASSFNENYLKLLYEDVSRSAKNIEFVAIELNTKMLLPPLTKINESHHLQQVPMLSEINDIEEHMKVIRGIKCYNNEIETISADFIDSQQEYTYKEKVLRDIIDRLRIDCVNHANVHKEKKIGQASFGIGTAYSDISFCIVFDRKGRLGVQLIFPQQHTKKIFWKLYNSMREEIDDRFDYILTWDVKFCKVETYFPFWNYNGILIKRFCRIIKRYLFDFDKYIRFAMQN